MSPELSLGTVPTDCTVVAKPIYVRIAAHCVCCASGLHTEGIYRQCAVMSQIQDLRVQANQCELSIFIAIKRLSLSC